MPKIASPDPDAAGIYLRKKTYWLRHTVDGARYFSNLRTHDFAEAVTKAKAIRGIAPEGKRKTSWDMAIKKYLAEKQAGIRPSHLAGRRLKSFRPDTTWRVESCLKTFATTYGIENTHEVRLSHLEDYYKRRRKNSEAGARSTLATIQAFLDHVKALPGRVIFSGDKKPESRQIVIPVETSNKWIDSCERPELAFVLFCGFHAGMRKSEITHSRIAWFDLTRRVLRIPGDEIQTLPNGKKFHWQAKDGDTREIPISQAFTAFLKTFLKGKKDFCLLGRRSKNGLMDFRLPFEKFVAAQGRPDCTIHAMRHSWITELCNSGNHSITEVAAWSGDTIETIESNYWKKRVKTGSLDQTMLGKRSRDEQEALIQEIARTVKGKSEEEIEEKIREAVLAALEILPD